MLKSVRLPNSRKQKPTAHQDNSSVRESHFKTVQHRPTREPYTHQQCRKPAYHLKEHEKAFAQNQPVMITNAEGTNGVKLDTEASPVLPPQWTGNAEAHCALKQDTSSFYSRQSLIPSAASARGLHQSGVLLSSTVWGVPQKEALEHPSSHDLWAGRSHQSWDLQLRPRCCKPHVFSRACPFPSHRKQENLHAAATAPCLPHIWNLQDSYSTEHCFWNSHLLWPRRWTSWYPGLHLRSLAGWRLLPGYSSHASRKKRQAVSSTSQVKWANRWCQLGSIDGTVLVLKIDVR